MREEWAVYGQNSAPTTDTIFNLQNFNLAQPLENANKKRSYTTETCEVFCADKCVCVRSFVFIHRLCARSAIHCSKNSRIES
jgi:hypothetical protein